MGARRCEAPPRCPDQEHRMYRSLTLPGALYVFGTRTQAASARHGAPAINVDQTPTSIDIQVFAPGLDADKLDVSIERGVLTLAGARSTAPDAGERKVAVLSRERRGGSFHRTV